MSESPKDDELNPAQKRAVEHVFGPMLVVAGAGTGKTTVLTERVSYLIEHRHARPDEILAVTFTRNAAEELRERVAARVGPVASQQVVASTFHSYCAQLLKRSEVAFEPLSREDLWIYLRQRIAELGLEHFIRPSDLGDFLGDLLHFFDRCSDENVSAASYQAYVTKVAAGKLAVPLLGRTFAELPPEQRLERLQEIARVYERVERMLAADHLGTFGQQITRALGLLQADNNLLRECSARARFILVDEFQDCNTTQIHLVRLLAGREENVFVVGDPDQAIYRFRGASNAAFDQFLKLFPHCTGAVLQENQRSRSPILNCSYAVIGENPEVKVPIGANRSYGRTPLESARDKRMGKKVPAPAPVEIVTWTNVDQETADIAERICEVLVASDKDVERGDNDRKPWFAVLYRQHSHREILVTELARRGVPHIVKGVDVQETGEVRDLMAILRAVDSPGDSESLFRVASLRLYAVPGYELRERLASAGGMGFAAILSSLPQGAAVLKSIEETREFARGRVLSAVVTWCIDRFGMDCSSQAVIAFRNFVEVWKKKPMVRRGDLREFLEYMQYFADAGGSIPLRDEEEQERLEGEDLRSVRLMTVHGAKGLEFRHVFVVRASSPSFPTSYRTPLIDFPAELRSFPAPADSKSAHEQEERRMFYVAMTRARDTLALYAKEGRSKKDKTPTGFLRSLLGRCKGQPFLRLSSAPPAAKPGEACPTGADVLEHPEGAPPSRLGEWFSLLPRSAEPPILSAHSVETYNDCPLRYKLERDWAIPGEPTAAIHFGDTVHRVLKTYYDPHAPAITADQVAQTFRHEWEKIRIDDPEQHALYARRGEAQLREFILRYPRASAQVIATEQSFRFYLGEMLIRGRIDRVDRLAGKTVRILDYKTGKPRRKEHADESLQLSIYAMAAAGLGYDVDSLVFANVQNAEEIVTRRNPDQLEEARLEIERAAAGIAAGKFDAAPGFHCRWCVYNELCPATEEKLPSLGAAGAGMH